MYGYSLFLVWALSSVVATSRHHGHTTPFNPRPDNHTVCYKSVGCFSNHPPFDNAMGVLPMSPHDIGTTFLLYTRANAKHANTINHVDAGLLQRSRFDPKLKTKFVIHGFSNTIKTPWLYTLKDALLKREPCNVIVVIWGPGAAMPDYSQAVANTRVVAKQVKMVIDILTRQGAHLNQMHLIGHSLGAHTSGHVGHLLNLERRTLGRITGLDPAEPEYLDHPITVRLDKTDAAFVDVIHTNGAPIMKGGYGMLQACGDVDFYVNGGEVQTGCGGTVSSVFQHIGDLFTGKVNKFGEAVTCSHMRSHEYFEESINSNCSFTAYPCDSNDRFQRGECLSCGSHGCGVLGYYSDWYKARGKLYLNTRGSKPYCGHHYFIEMRVIDQTRGIVEVQLHGQWGVTEWMSVSGSDKQQTLDSMSFVSRVAVSSKDVGDIHSVSIRYSKAPWHILHFSSGNPTLHAQYVRIVAGENGKRYKLCIPRQIADHHETTVTLQKNSC